MTPELLPVIITIIGVGVAQAVFMLVAMLVFVRMLSRRISEWEERISQGIREWEEGISQRLESVGTRA